MKTHLVRGLLYASAFACIIFDTAAAAKSYVLLGVSGGLQDGFPDHVKLDYHHGKADEVQAIFIGRGLVRGAKAFLDVMQEGWRQYAAEPEQPLINSNVMVSGCAEHANEYWVYAVDSRQLLTILNNEPRFLSITPDTGLVDLQSSHTDAAVRALAQHEITRQGKTDLDFVALPIVVSTWYNVESYVPSPPIATINDDNGTRTNVTNFQESMALWAGVNDEDRTCGITTMNRGVKDCVRAHKRYWDGIRQAIRAAEANRQNIIQHNKQQLNTADTGGPLFTCQRKTRLGVGPDTARINYPFTTDELVNLFLERGYKFDVENGILVALGYDEAGDEL